MICMIGSWLYFGDIEFNLDNNLKVIRRSGKIVEFYNFDDDNVVKDNSKFNYSRFISPFKSMGFH